MYLTLLERNNQTNQSFLEISMSNLAPRAKGGKSVRTTQFWDNLVEQGTWRFSEIFPHTFTKLRPESLHFKLFLLLPINFFRPFLPCLGCPSLKALRTNNCTPPSQDSEDSDEEQQQQWGIAFKSRYDVYWQILLSSTLFHRYAAFYKIRITWWCLTILSLPPRDKEAMLGVKPTEFFLEEFTWK